MVCLSLSFNCYYYYYYVFFFSDWFRKLFIYIFLKIEWWINSKTLLKLTIPRIKLLRNRREIQIRQMRRDIAKLLETGQEATARIRVSLFFFIYIFIIIICWAINPCNAHYVCFDGKSCVKIIFHVSGVWWHQKKLS